MRMIVLTAIAFLAALAVLYFSLRYSPSPAPAALARAHAALFAHPARQAGK